MSSPIPLIDLSISQSPEALRKAIQDAVTSVGFLHVRGLKGITREKVANAFEIHKELYDSPLEERASIPQDRETRNGYLAVRGTRLNETGGADAKESFVFGHFKSGETRTSQPLPPALEKRKEELIEFHALCHEAFCELLDVFSLNMNLPEDYFRTRHDMGTNSISLINYPPFSAEEASSALSSGPRAGAHKDWGAITLLFQQENGTPGLEIFLPDKSSTIAAKNGESEKPYVLAQNSDLSKGTWVSAPIVEDTVLCNVGLALEAWTNGLYKATLHRVVFPESKGDVQGFKGRRSIAFFSQPRHDVVFNPIMPDGQILVTPGALNSQEFFLERMKASAY